ncbi:MAG: hypothetical protein A2270_09455 [Elusimicrobia bacterium RIFOXYA12_FULL_51_18]|nr:MAG: hypothetical protein A2270_09455 [Elusimicrobia bacterium RIFOXYA12_FULL_51_18]OGS32727.1 MAG: hypothetical protein A2218_11770 [Elusimicrobia bacterium RIFOXYA2_FULL_53_38]
MTATSPKSLFSILCFLFVLTAPAAALELSLEENKGESGTVGYVDIDRVFKEYSGTLNAREEFLGEIKKKEESVNQRRHEIYALKADIAKLKQEREFALTLPSLLATQEQMSLEKLQAAATPLPVQTSTTAAPLVSASTPASTSDAPQISTSLPAPTTAQASTAAIPLVSTSIPAASTQVQTSPAAAPPAPPAIPISSLPGLGIDMPGVSKVPASYFKFSVSTAVPEIDAAIIVKETDLRKKEEALKIYQRQVEKELLEYESHRSEILLGRIYLALKELAVKQEVSVIVDKRNILFGHSAVDLTGKLLEKLEEEQ